MSIFPFFSINEVLIQTETLPDLSSAVISCALVHLVPLLLETL
jgi:hypothetical protein